MVSSYQLYFLNFLYALRISKFKIISRLIKESYDHTLHITKNTM